MQIKVSVIFILCMVLAGVTLGFVLAHIITGNATLWVASYFVLAAFLLSSIAFILEELNWRWNKW